jgi:hypothetical protein
MDSRVKRELKRNKIKQLGKTVFCFIIKFIVSFLFLAMQQDETLKAIRYQRGSLSILDQLKLPDETIYIPIHTVDDAWKAIHTMAIRGMNHND